MKILDVCCGSKMFWFQKNHSSVTYMDIRQEEFEIHGKKVNVQPDVIADFRNIPFADNSFDHVVFDPPHLLWAGTQSIMKAQYGQLNKNTWKQDLVQGFDECMRVLKPTGTLVFKWSDAQVNVSELLKSISYNPLYGNKRGKTHWLVFIKEVS